MSAIAKQKLFESGQRITAFEALDALSDKEKVNFALALLMKITDPDAAACMRFAGNQLVELSNILMREAFERECG